ncbi:SGNH/GDSL hydrolase family protein [Pedobacter africanus]|uniref:Lysophospholipase L1 n=1 Tax=Pedobacter africanus TaxID=151894 RepID=A0A1W2BI11_9SPHI|nr:SGNH/GDSL hydrolase family protein [Pedobacter africanus]SMC72526.1 Lysophospholipase L1 [Pedobacter africanus]
MINDHTISYLALGDSYTIGEAVPAAGSFPYQLAGRLRVEQIIVEEPHIVATTGWTSSELQAAIKNAALARKFDLVTLLVGVNNQYRGESITVYRREFAALLQTALDFARGDKARVFVLSIPDWGATPFGLASGRGREAIALDIDAFNAVNKEETLLAGLSYTDITPASRDAVSDPLLVAEDGLHPSVKMYSDWVNNLLPAVLKVLK